MLKLRAETEAVEAEKVRVNPQELMEALRTVEERKAAEVRAHEETLPLGEAIQTLGLTYSPEEVLEALKAHRAQQEQTTLGLSISSHKRRTGGGVVLAAVLSLAALSFVIGSFALWTVSAVHSSAQAPAIAVVTPTPAVSPPAGFQMKPLREIGVGGTFMCDTSTLMHLANGTAGPNTMVAVSGEQNDLWGAIRVQNGIEVQGTMTTADALRLSNGDQATLYRTPELLGASQSFTSVRVPLSRLPQGDSGRLPQGGSTLGSENYLNVDPLPVKPR